LIPKKEPQVNGGVENFNGRFQQRLFQRRFARQGDRRRELARLQEAVNTPEKPPEELPGMTGPPPSARGGRPADPGRHASQVAQEGRMCATATSAGATGSWASPSP
jgi:hypothetical protein